MSQATLYGTITRATKLDDGSVYVEGCASTESRVEDPGTKARFGKGQMFTADAMRAAIPDYLKYGNVREMHQPIAAGKASWMEVRDDGRTYMGAHVVDEGSAKKVLAGVLQAFSIGGNVTRRNASDPSIVEGLDLIEVSLVDRPGDEAVERFSVIRMREGVSMDPVKTKPVPAPVPTPEAPPTTAVPAPPPAAGEIPAPAAAVDAPPAPVVIARIDAVKRFDGRETFDAQTALDALKLVQALLWSESGEFHPEPPEQMEALKTVIEKLKAFIASEIAEADEEEAVEQAAPMPEVTRVAEPAPELVTRLAAVEKDLTDKVARVAELEKRVPELEDIVSRAGEALKSVIGERDKSNAALADISDKLDVARADLQRKGVLRLVAVDKAKDGVARAAEPVVESKPDIAKSTTDLIREALKVPSVRVH